jgi:hypothetical protein
VHLCIVCRTPIKTHTNVICEYCVADIEKDLVRVDEVMAELQVTKNRQDVAGERNGGTGTKLDAPAPINLTALAAEMKLHKALMGWALKLVQERIEAWDTQCVGIRDQWHAAGRKGSPAFPPKPKLPGRTVHHLSNYLMGRLPYLATQASTVYLKQRLTRLLDECAKVCEREAPKIFAGACPEVLEGVECGTYVYEPQGSTTARCKTCGYTWDIIEWTGRALVSKEYVIGYPPALSRMLSTGGVPVTEQDIRNWAARGIIERANPETNEHGKELRAMYRLGDVLDAWQATRKQAA